MECTSIVLVLEATMAAKSTTMDKVLTRLAEEETLAKAVLNDYKTGKLVALPASELPSDPFFMRLKSEQTLDRLTGLPESSILPLFFMIEEIATKPRGASPRLTLLDSMILLLIRYRTGNTYDQIGAIFGVSETSTKENFLFG